MSGDVTAGRLEAVAADLAQRYPLISRGLSPQSLVDEPGPLRAARQAMDFAWRRCGEDPEKLSAMVEAFALLSYDFLRLQSRFMQTGHYARSTASGLLAELYSNADEMLRRYLDGLLLSYALWPNHARILDFFRQSVVESSPPDARFREVGVGHGLMAYMLLSTLDRADYVGIDLSPHSIAYCRQALEHDVGIDGGGTRWRFIEADASEAARMADPGDWVICCEVLEHVDRPEALLASCRALISDDGLGFVTTVANLEAEDHVYLFSDAAEIRSLFDACGFAVVEELVLPLPGSEESEPLPLNYAAVIRRV